MLTRAVRTPTSPTISVLENAGQVTVTVVRSSSSGPFQVDFATEGVTANAGEDYEETMGVLSFKVRARARLTK